MTTPDAAVQIVADALPVSYGVLAARVAVAALARAGWLHDPAEVAARKRDGETWRRAIDEYRDQVAAVRQFLDADSLEPVSPASQARRAALRAIVDAVPAVPQPADETQRQERGDPPPDRATEPR